MFSILSMFFEHVHSLPVLLEQTREKRKQKITKEQSVRPDQDGQTTWQKVDTREQSNLN